MINTAVPVFICTPQLKPNAKAARLNRLPRHLKEFVEGQCKDALVGTLAGEPPDTVGEFIVGAAWVRFQSQWSPMLPMNDQKRAMCATEKEEGNNK